MVSEQDYDGGEDIATEWLERITALFEANGVRLSPAFKSVVEGGMGN